MSAVSAPPPESPLKQRSSTQRIKSGLRLGRTEKCRKYEAPSLRLLFVALLTQAASTRMCQRLVAATCLTGAISYRQISGARLIPRFSVWLSLSRCRKGACQNLRQRLALRSEVIATRMRVRVPAQGRVLPRWPLRAIFKCIHVCTVTIRLE